ncbi:MAG: LysR family transcriptional regulator [Negativicutes bacterium]|nr:LysR family transcriptional regulator [Negativicutes bacterium]
MDIRHLEYFLEVVRQGSFSKAAAILHITQPSISKMIKSLEDDLGVPLIYRNSKQVSLTDAGQAVLEQSQQIVTLFHNLSGEIDDIVHLKKGKVRIGIPPIAGSTIFPPLLGEFNKHHPHIQIQLFEFGSKKVELGVQDGSLDIGIVCTLPSKTDIFEILSFVQDPLQVIVHPEHHLAGYPAVDFAALANEPFVLYSDDFSLYDHIHHRCKLSGFQPRIICETSQREFMTQMVAAKLGVALLPSKICDQLDPQTLVAIPLTDPQIFLHLSLIWRKDRYLSFAARRWLEFTSTELGITPPTLNRGTEIA